MGTHMIVLSEGYPMNSNMTGFSFFKNLGVLVLWRKVALALEVNTKPYTLFNPYAAVGQFSHYRMMQKTLKSY